MEAKEVSKEISEYYDLFYQQTNDVDFYLKEIKRIGGSVLELGCGTGRVLISIAEQGHKVTGLDISRDMLNQLRKKIKDKIFASNVELVEGDMKDFYLTKRFGIALMPYRPFQHLLTKREQERCLKNTHKHLEDGGYLVMDVFNPHAKPEQVFGHREETVDGNGNPVAKIITSSLDRERQLIDVELTIDEPGKTKTMKFQMSYMFKDQLQEMLEKNGFSVERVYGDFDRRPFTRESPEIIVVARKQNK